MAAYCYYVLDAPIMDDSEYDKLSRDVVKHWRELDDDLQWALGNPNDTRSSGSHFKYSSRVVHAVCAKFDELGRDPPQLPTDWKISKQVGRYVTGVVS
jgi:hypothetical protein